MDASKITELLQKQNTRYINRNQTVDSSTLIWKNQIQSSKYIKGVKTCNGEQNWNVPTNSGCQNKGQIPTGICSFGGAGRTTAIQTGSSQQFLSVYSGASGSASQIYSSDIILLQKAGKDSCAVPTECQNSSIVLPACYCTDTNIPENSTINNQSNPYLPPFDTYYSMKHPECIKVDQHQKHFVKQCHTPFINNNGPNIFPSGNTTYLDPITKQFQTNPFMEGTNQTTCDNCILQP